MESPPTPGRTGPGRAYRSRLEPFTDFIRDQRRQRRTWAEIAAALREQGVSISLQGVHQFFRRWVKRKPRWEHHATEAQVPPSPPTAGTASPRKPPVRAALPQVRGFRRPSLSDLTLNDPLNP